MQKKRNSFKFFIGSCIYTYVRTLLALIGVVLLGAFATKAQAAHTQASLILSESTARPGSSIMAGIHLHMDQGWHTYWRNPGDSGIPTKIKKWELPAGVTVGEIQWPVPEKMFIGALTAHVYNDDVVLLVPLTISSDVKPGPLKLAADLSWLECSETSCVPGRKTVEASLNISGESAPSPEATLIETFKKRLPQSKPDLAASASWEANVTTNTRPIVFEWASNNGFANPDFFPFDNTKYEFLTNAHILPLAAGKLRVQKILKKTAGDWPAKLSGLLVEQTGEAPIAYEADLAITSSSNPQIAPTPPPTTTSGTRNSDNADALAAPGTQSMPMKLFYAFLGGMILNIMPCVLPVIALKILGFVSQAHDHPREVRKLGLVYAAGVLTSFLVLAGLIIGVKLAGHRAGWGMQFSNPQFIVIMTILVTLVALNLFGLFEITPGSKVMSAAGTLAAREGTSGAFFNGILATVLATPCTAPFLSVALGFALAPQQSNLIVVLFFLTIGVGLAFPYVLLSFFPQWLKFLPKPGIWMEKFKIAMGFPMLATAFWLFSLTFTHYGKRVWWLGIFLVLVGMAAWIYGDFIQRGRKRKGIAAALALALLIFGYTFVVEGKLQWRSPIVETGNTASLKESPDGIDWQRWSSQAVTQARAAGRPVIVDFTADWCATCQANKSASIDVPSVREKLRQLNGLAFVADYTKTPPEITEELNRYERSAVPLVLVFSANTNRPPEILPENLWALGPGVVLKALDKAVQK
ncbi:protein-disulfide reductase DsbD family protein [Pedosphaera parvula]|uniref:Cytochrome c biogenesis protein transmembrane region n=1 Tax=Pedosphaera parvula (strain Ellin514) TaxID=320771 RepID=B9XFG9_PEDPL|nr:protein-disulfide reductase DsbD domain-containing protein [Pedosphaera parvula]EEF61333.1 cytochrome c biogenesis protein transmembrane region [Pedosphaera parvula Ellin514]